MAARGHLTSALERQDVQASGMMQHGSLLLEHKVATQAAEIERLTEDNRRFATAHLALRGELVNAQQELQRLKAHIRSVRAESDIQIRILLDKISKMEADIRAGENVKKELKQAHLEANGLAKDRQDLTNQIQQASKELQKVQAEGKILPDLRAELEKLRVDHKRLRITFDYEKGLNVEKVEQLKAMEQKLIGMAGEVEKLHAEVLNAEKTASAPNPYGTGYPNPHPSYPVAHGGGSYVDVYGRPLVQPGFGPAANGIIPYGGTDVIANDLVADATVTNAGSGSAWAGPYDPSLAHRHPCGAVPKPFSAGTVVRI